MSYQSDRITGIPAPLPKDYDRQTNFTDYQTANPGKPIRGTDLDAEFNAIEQATDETQARLRLIQRDDGALANRSVGLDQLTQEAQIGVNAPTDWAEFTQYNASDSVIVDDGAWYICLESHVSSDDFQADLSAGKWRELINLTPYTTEAKNWATYPEDDPVPEGNGSQYSALHHATKALAAQAAANLSAQSASDDATQTAADRVQTGQDATQTAADRVQTGLDRTAASNAATTATNKLTEFQGQYYGAYASDPTEDPNGNPPGAGDLYFSTTAPVGLRGYDAAAGVWRELGNNYQGVYDRRDYVVPAGGEDTFAVTYEGSLVEVIVNGDVLPRADYTANSGTEVVLDSTLPEGTEVTVIGLGKFDVADVTNALVTSASGTQSIGTALDKRALHVPDIAALRALTGVPDGQRVSVTGYHPGSDIGGGEFYYDASRAKADHDGGYTIDPDKALPTDWADRAQLYEWFDGSGSVGTGCFVALEDNGEINLQRFGCFADGVGDDSVQVQRALLTAVVAGRMAYAPAGTYLKGFNLDGTCPFSGSRWYEFSEVGGAFLGLRGEGKGVTTFKVADGLITARGRFTHTFGTTGEVIGDFIQKDFTIDQNGTNNPLNTGDGLYEFEQAHAWKVSDHNNGMFSDIEVVDKVGGGVVHSAGEAGHTKYIRISSRDFSGNFGQRADVEIQGFPRQATIQDPNVDYIQTEPNGANPAGYKTVISVIGGSVDSLDANGTENRELTTFILSGLSVNKHPRLSSGYYEIANCDMSIPGGQNVEWINSKIHMTGGALTYLVEAGDIGRIYPRVTVDDTDYVWSFLGVDFRIDSTDAGFSPATGGQAVNMLSTYSGTHSHVFRLDGCTFDPRFKQVANQYRSFQLEVARSKIRCTGPAFRVGTDRDGNQAVTLRDNDYSEFEGGNVLDVILAAGNAGLFSADIAERMGSDKWGMTGSGAGNLESAGNYTVNVELVGDADPASGMYNGVRRHVQSPTAGQAKTVFYSGGSAVVDALAGSAIYDPASLADGASETTTVTVTGAALGDFATASFGADLQGVTLDAWVSAADTVSVKFTNNTGGTVDLASATLRARVEKA